MFQSMIGRYGYNGINDVRGGGINCTRLYQNHASQDRINKLSSFLSEIIDKDGREEGFWFLYALYDNKEITYYELERFTKGRKLLVFH